MADSQRRISSPEAFADAFGVSRETLDKLRTYEALLNRWQKTINLVAAGSLADVWHRHFADSAQLWQYRPGDTGKWLDIGSGAGFPGLVLAILAAESGRTHHVLVESDSRKAAFLKQVARETGTAVDIVGARIENAETLDSVGSVACITARGVAPLPRLAGWIAPYFARDTVALLLKGRTVASELDEAALGWSFLYALQPSVTDQDARIVLLKALHVRTEG